MRWLKKIIREAVDDAMMMDITSVDWELTESTPETLAIPVEIRIDGSEPPKMSDEHVQSVISLARSDVLRQEIERYIGEQFKLLAITPEEKEANMVRGKIFGASEFLRGLLEIEFESREGVELEAMAEEEQSSDEGRHS